MPSWVFSASTCQHCTGACYHTTNNHYLATPGLVTSLSPRDTTRPPRTQLSGHVYHFSVKVIERINNLCKFTLSLLHLLVLLLGVILEVGLVILLPLDQLLHLPKHGQVLQVLPPWGGSGCCAPTRPSLPPPCATQGILIIWRMFSQTYLYK